MTRPDEFDKEYFRKHIKLYEPSIDDLKESNPKSLQYQINRAYYSKLVNRSKKSVDVSHHKKQLQQQEEPNDKQNKSIFKEIKNEIKLKQLIIAHSESLKMTEEAGEFKIVFFVVNFYHIGSILRRK